MEVGCEVAILRRIPVMTGRNMIVRQVRRAAGGRPVLVLRVIEAELDALLLTLLREFAKRIAMKGRSGRNIEAICLRIEHGEAIVMFGCDDDVLHARRLRERDDIVRIECAGIEAAGKCLVVGNRDPGWRRCS